MELSNRLKELRAKSNITQEQLAKAVGVSRQTIISIEGGQYTPSALLALRVARVLKSSFEEVFYMTNDKENK
jgi:putative transcriptional regulator